MADNRKLSALPQAGVLGAADRMYLVQQGLSCQATLGQFVTFAAATMQPAAANLTALSGLEALAGRLPYFTGAGAMATAPTTAFGRSVLNVADAGAGRTLLGSASQTELDTLASGTTTALAAKADKTASITGAGLVSGGGALDANRTLTVAEASEAEALAGVLADKAMTPRRTKAVVDSVVEAAVGAAVDELQASLEDLAAGQAGGTIAAESWAVLAAYPTTDRAAGDYARVIGADAGTHTDPVAGGTVPNRGAYRWSASPAGWRRVGNLDSDDAAGFAEAAEAAAVAAIATTAPTALLPSCVTHFYPCDEGAGQSLRDVIGGADIDLSTIAGAAWSKDGTLSLTSAYFLTPTITARAMFMVLRNRFGALAGYVMTSPSGKAVGQFYAGGASFSSIRCLSGQGLHVLKMRSDAGGSAAYELGSGGWVAPLATLPNDETGTFVIGAGNLAGAGRADYFEIAAIGYCNAAPSDDDAQRIRIYLRHLLSQRRIFIAPQDCPSRAELVVICGESTSEGTMPLSALTGAERDVRSHNTFIVAVNAGSQTSARRLARLTFSSGTANNNPPSKSAFFGFEWGLLVGQNRRADYGMPLHLLKVAQGSTFSLPSGAYTNAAGGTLTIGTSASRNAGEFTSTTNGLHYGLEARQYYRCEAQARNEGVGYVSVMFVETDGLNDAFVGDQGVTSAAQYQNYLQQRYDARRADYGISNVQMIVVYPHLPQGGLGGGDPDYPNNAVGSSRLNALQYIRSGMAAFVAANADNVAGIDANDLARYPVNSSNGDWAHWNKAGYENLGVDIHTLLPFSTSVIPG